MFKLCLFTIMQQNRGNKMENGEQSGAFQQQSDNPCQEQSVLVKKKASIPCTNRMLKNHDLDLYLVYQKRNSKPNQFNDMNKILPSTQPKPKKWKKIEKKQKISDKEIKKSQDQQRKELLNLKQQRNLKNNQDLQHQQSKKNTQQKQNISKINIPVSKLFKKQQKIKRRRMNRKQKYQWKQQDSQYEQVQQRRQIFINKYMTDNEKQYFSILKLNEQLQQQFQNPDKSTYINCDVKYFNWNLFSEEVGKFDVLIIDPPWRIKGAQQNDSQFMFSNSKFSLEYNTMSNNQIEKLPLHLISDEGFIFLWILNTQLDSSLEIMQKWGYQLIDQLIWVKLRDNKVYLTHGYYFMHSYEICLIGYKNKANKKSSITQLQQIQPLKQALFPRSQLSPNVIFGDVNLKSQKPIQLYEIIDMMFRGKKKIQIFARNHNRRFGIFSVGNQLGESYQKWLQSTNCDECSNSIHIGMKRYKSNQKPNYDLCMDCVKNHDIDKFFQLENEVNEDIRHLYISCNECNAEPIWGNRFYCETCHNFDLCQMCFDKHLEGNKSLHPQNHKFGVLQVPIFGNDFAVHENKCYCCYQNPIVGICYSCVDCRNFKLCQKCFFQRPKGDSIFNSKNHRAQHEFQAIFQPQYKVDKKFQCFSCKKLVLQNCWKCINCYNFFFCEDCYVDRNKFKSLYANSHKKYHVCLKIF